MSKGKIELCIWFDIALCIAFLSFIDVIFGKSAFVNFLPNLLLSGMVVVVSNIAEIKSAKAEEEENEDERSDSSGSVV